MQEIGRLFNPFPPDFTSDKTDRVAEKCLFLHKKTSIFVVVVAFFSFHSRTFKKKKRLKLQLISCELSQEGDNRKLNFFPNISNLVLSQLQRKYTQISVTGQSQRCGRDMSLYFSPPHVFVLSYYQIVSTVKQ